MCPLAFLATGDSVTGKNSCTIGEADLRKAALAVKEEPPLKEAFSCAGDDVDTQGLSPEKAELLAKEFASADAVEVPAPPTVSCPYLPASSCLHGGASLWGGESVCHLRY